MHARIVLSNGAGSVIERAGLRFAAKQGTASFCRPSRVSVPLASLCADSLLSGPDGFAAAGTATIVAKKAAANNKDLLAMTTQHP